MSTKKHQTKFIFVTGGVISGLGKGITTASLGLLIESLNVKVAVLKADMYLNVDAGTMNPLEHGEVFVTQDGKETDQDMGHYERFLSRDLFAHSYITMGQIYNNVLKRERSLGYGGKCVEGHIHIPEEIIKNIKTVAEKEAPDVILIEVGGTVGEHQNTMFYEAMRRMKQMDPKNVFLVHLVYLPIPLFLGEMKSKPAQASIYELYNLGLQPDFVICRSSKPIDKKRKETISKNTGVKLGHIFSAEDVDTIYKVPVLFANQKIAENILDHVKIKYKKMRLNAWKKMLKKSDAKNPKVKVAIVGKYFKSGDFSLEDSYVCVIEAIKHAAWNLDLTPEITWFDVERMENKNERKKAEGKLKSFDGIIVPQGWGSRGVEGKIKVVQFVRENNIPYLGLCFGMQMATIEYARHVVGLDNANSQEVNAKSKHKVIHIMPDQEKYLKEKNYGGTIRLGNWPCALKKGSILQSAYKTFDPQTIENNTVQERHRHRYEVNISYKKQLEDAGLVFSGTSPDKKLIEAVELPKKVHKFFVGTQYHPEYKSKPLKPHPLFLAFITSCAED